MCACIMTAHQHYIQRTQFAHLTTHLITLETHFELTRLVIAMLHTSLMCLWCITDRLWEVKTGDCLQKRDGHTDIVR
jgi:hypothetical protein